MTHRLSPDLRDSGVPWLGRIRADWEVVPAKAVFAARDERSRRDDVHLTPSQQYGVLPQEEYMAITGNKVVLNLTGSDNMKHVEPDDFIIHLRSFQGGIEHSSHRGKVSMAYTVLAPRPGAHPGFFRWALKSPTYIQALQSTTDQLRDGQSIKYGQFGTIPLPRPSLDEQRAIADFLDRETAQIDAMIDAQERLVALLRQRRDASILSATTKGLDQSRRLKDSGETWIGPMPEHWVVSRVSWMFRDIGSGTTPENEDLLDEGDHYWVTTSELRESVITSTKRSVARETLSGTPALRLYEPGTLLIAMYGATIGRLGILGIPACVNQACCALAKPQGVLSKFAYYALLAAREHLLHLGSGAGQPNISQGKIRSLRLPLPPLGEQAEIIEYLEDVTARTDVMIAKAQESIALMRERRATLISAAVTGRIDVRTGVEYPEKELEGVGV